MSWTYDEVMAALGDEAQAVPGAIIVFRNKHIVVAETSTDRGFKVTDAGAALLAEFAPPLEQTQAPKLARKPRKPVESANTSATAVEPDLDLED